MPHYDPSLRENGEQFPHSTAAERGLAAAGERALLEAARRAEGRTAEIVAAMAGLGAETAAFEDRLQARLAQRFDQLRDRLLLSSEQTLQALDRALDAARVGDHRAPLMADAIRVRRQLASVMDDEDEESSADARDPLATLVEAPAATASHTAAPIWAETQSDTPVPASWRGVAARARTARSQDDEPANATLVVAEPEALLIRPAAESPSHSPNVHRVAAPPAPPREVSRRRHVLPAALLMLLAVVVVSGALIRPGPGQVPARPEAPRRPSPSPEIPEQIQKVFAHPAIEQSKTPPEADTRSAHGPLRADTAPPRREAAPAATEVVPPVLPPPGVGPASVARTVADVLAEAAKATAASDYDTAVARYAEALAMDAGNADAKAGSERARGERAALGRVFATQPTVRDAQKTASSGKNCGPFGCPEPARVLDCKLEYRMSPAAPAQGAPYRVEIVAINTGKETFKVKALTAVVSVNGEQVTQALELQEKELGVKDRKVIGTLEAAWKPGTTSWWFEATVTDQKRDSYRAQLTWDPKPPAAR